MRYRKLSPRMWGDERFRALSAPQPNAQTLWIYLLTGPHTTLIPGLFSAGEAGLAEALGWPLKSFRGAFQELHCQGMAQADWQGRVVFLPKALKYNPSESPSVVKAWAKALELPECPPNDRGTQEFTLRDGKRPPKGDPRRGQRGHWWIRWACPHGHLHREHVGPKSLASKKAEGKRQDRPCPRRTVKPTHYLLADVIREYLAATKALKHSWKDDARHGKV